MTVEKTEKPIIIIRGKLYSAIPGSPATIISEKGDIYNTSPIIKADNYEENGMVETQHTIFLVNDDRFRKRSLMDMRLEQMRKAENTEVEFKKQNKVDGKIISAIVGQPAKIELENGNIIKTSNVISARGVNGSGIVTTKNSVYYANNIEKTIDTMSDVSYEMIR